MKKRPEKDPNEEDPRDKDPRFVQSSWPVPSKPLEIDFTKVYPEAVDRHGHSDHVRLRLPFGMTAAIIKQIKETQFDSPQVFMRTAIVQYSRAFAEYQKENQGFEDRMLFEAHLQADLDRDRSLLDRQEQAVVEIEEGIDKGKELLDVSLMRQILKNVELRLTYEMTSPVLTSRLERAREEVNRWLAQHDEDPKDLI